MAAPNQLPASLRGFQRLHQGESILVCGCGASLSTLQNPERFITIGVNDVGRLFTPDYLVVLNPRHQFRGDRFQYVEQSKAKALFTQLSLGVPHPHIVRFQLGTRGGVSFNNPDVLHYTRNSPYVAVCLAVHMGAARVGVIGVDFTENHFFAKTGRHALAGELAQIDKEYAALYKACVEAGVEVFNLSEESRLSALPKTTLDDFAERSRRPRSLRIVSYSCTPVAGVPAILARCINASTPHSAIAAWESNSYSNGVTFEGGLGWRTNPAEAEEAIRAADLFIVHNGKVHPRHEALLRGKPVMTMAHNYLWNVNTRFVKQGYPGMVVGQYQAALPEFQGWHAVPNPVPLDEPQFQPEPKPQKVAICYTPSGKHERYPDGHRLYWHAKGYQTTMRVLDQLAARYPLELNVIRNGQISHAACLAMKRRSHIVIDECVTGSYHRNSLEGLAAGCVVVNGLGILPGVREVFARCCGTEDLPFVTCGLEGLERTLVSLIELGAARLEEMGLANHRWMERHWRFADQWTRFWQPAAETAMRCGRLAPALAAESTAAAAAPARRPSGLVSVIIPHRGEERISLLDATLAALKTAEGIGEVLVVESDDVPRARSRTERFGFRYIFHRSTGLFPKAAALRVGSEAAAHPYLLWLDNDILLPAAFAAQAAHELEERRLDCLIPYSAVHYLSAEDSEAVRKAAKLPGACRPLNTLYSRRGAAGGAVLVRREFFQKHGGIPEQFRGYGGEDSAWLSKARLFGSAAATNASERVIHHLYHPLCGACDPSGAMASNPQHAANVDLLRRIRACRTSSEFVALTRMPEPPAVEETQPNVEAPEVVACRALLRSRDPGDSELDWKLAFALVQSCLLPLGSVLDLSTAADLPQVFGAVYPLAAYHRADPERLAEFPDEVFDRVLLGDAIEHWPAPERAARLRRIAHKLKPGGLAIATARDAFDLSGAGGAAGLKSFQQQRAGAALGIVWSKRLPPSLPPERTVAICAADASRTVEAEATLLRRAGHRALVIDSSTPVEELARREPADYFLILGAGVQPLPASALGLLLLLESSSSETGGAALDEAGSVSDPQNASTGLLACSGLPYRMQTPPHVPAYAMFRGAALGNLAQAKVRVLSGVSYFREGRGNVAAASAQSSVLCLT